MTAIDVLRLAFAGVHEALRQDMATLNEVLLFAPSAAGMNHAGFLFWHLVREEDLVVHYVCRGETLWVTEGWAGRTDLGAAEQGTGFEAERAVALRYDVPEFKGYAERVWAATDLLLQAETEFHLARPVYDGDSTASKLLVDGCLGHNWVHLGEMRHALGLQGWRFRE